MTNIRLAKWNNEGREMKTIPSTAVTRNCKTKSEKSWDWSKRTQAFRSHIHLRNQNNISQPLENNFKRRKYRLGNNRQNIKVVGAKVRE